MFVKIPKLQGIKVEHIYSDKNNDDLMPLSKIDYINSRQKN